ncbi:MAG: sigma-70 family RNA polymerase sigma factor [Actinobacteria bacterium]|nr:sigma-70 family RNA polymerase sigma factor [Actinomycetota bacterium]
MVAGEVGALVGSAACGDENAWRELVDRFAGMIWAVARGQGLSAADAADVSQTTWLRFAEHVDSIRDPSCIGGWLATTARNESIALIRRGRRDIAIGAGPEVGRHGEEPDPASRLLESERDRALWKALDELPSRCRTLLRMLTAEPASTYAAISEVLDLPVGSIGPTRGRCLQQLRRSSEVSMVTGNGTWSLA